VDSYQSETSRGRVPTGAELDRVAGHEQLRRRYCVDARSWPIRSGRLNCRPRYETTESEMDEVICTGLATRPAWRGSDRRSETLHRRLPDHVLTVVTVVVNFVLCCVMDKEMNQHSASPARPILLHASWATHQTRPPAPHGRPGTDRFDEGRS